MSSKIHGKQLKDSSIKLVKIDPSTGQTLTLAGSSKIQQAAAPTTDNDLTNKYYVDSVAAGFDPKESSRVATLTDLIGVGATYSPTGGSSSTGAFYNAPTTLDGVGLTAGDRILVKDQLDLKQNGIYVVVGSTATWHRSSDMDGNPSTEVSIGNFSFITEGSTYGGNGFVVVSSGTWSGILPINTAPIVWTQFSGGGAFIWGDGLYNLGNVINIDLVANAGLTFSTTKLAIDSNIAGNGLGWSSGVINIGQGNGITVNSNDIAIDYTNVSQTLGGAGLTGTGILNVGAGTGITISADAVAVDYAAVAVALEGNGLTASAGVLSINTSNGVTILNDSVQLNQLVAGNGLTFSAGVVDINVVKGVTFSGDALFADASTILTTSYLSSTNVATNSTVQSALTAIDNFINGLQAATIISAYSNPTGTFLSSISIPVAVNSGVTFSRASDGESFVFMNGVSYPVGSATSSDFFFANGAVYSGALTASNSIYIGQYLWSNVNTLGFDIDTTDEIIVKYNAI